MPSNESSSSLVARTAHTGANEPDGSEYSFTLNGLIQGLRRYRSFITGCMLLGLLVALVMALLPRHYTAVSRVQVRPGSSSQYRVEKTDALGMGDDTSKLETESMILESDSLLLSVANKLHLDQDPDFMGWGAAKGDTANDPKAQEKLLTRLHKNIHATRIPRTEIVQVSANTKSAMLSARIVNTLVAEYIQHLFDSRLSSTQRVTKWLSGQLNDLKQQVEQDENDLLGLQSRIGLVGLDQNHDIVVAELEDLTKAADEARVERIVAEAKYRVLTNGDSNLLEGGQDLLGHNVPNSSQLSLLANLRNQKAQTEAHLAGLTQQFGSDYPEVKQTTAELATLNREIQQEQARVLNQAHQAFDAASSDEQKTISTLQGKKSQAFQKQSDMARYQILLHDFESNRSLYEGLVERLRQAGIVAGLDSSEVDIVDMARIPGKPSEISRVGTVALGLLFGLATGLTGAFLVAQFDHRARDLAQIEAKWGLPVLSSTPAQARSIDDIPALFAGASHSTFVESMWLLRSSLIEANGAGGARTLMFTGSGSGEGSTTFACAEACALALSGAAVLLIDANMRRPAVAQHFKLTNKIGLASVLAGSADAGAAIQPVASIPTLSVMTSGPKHASVPQLLDPHTMADLFGVLKSRFDYVVIDTPPLSGLADASIFARYAETIVLVTSFAQLNGTRVESAIKTLHRAGKSFAGIALNFVEAGDYDEGYSAGAADMYSDKKDRS